MITNNITMDKRISELSDDTSRLAFTWLITFADCEGRTRGDPAVLRSILFPRRDDISLEQMEYYIREWHDAGLIVRYEAKGDLYIYFPAFDKNQANLRKDREAPSEIPEPPSPTQSQTVNSNNDGVTPDNVQDNGDNHHEQLRSNSGATPEQLPVKLREVKLREVEGEVKEKPSPSAAFSENIAAMKVFIEVTGMFAFPGSQRDEAETALTTLYYRHGDRFRDEMTKYYNEWTGRGYKKLNLAWLTDWFMAGEIPPRGDKNKGSLPDSYRGPDD
jgi:hypothetical protein